MFSNRPKWFFVMAAWLFWLMPAYAYAVDVSLTGIVEEGGNTQVTVQLSGPVPDNGMMSDYTFTWTLMDGSAANKFNSFADFSSYSSTPGMDEKINYTGTSNSFSLPVVDDSANEGTEVGELCISTNDSMWPAGTFTYSTALSYDGSTGTACFSLTLNDNDAPPTIAFNSSSSANSEAVSSVSIPVSLSASWSSTITVNYTVIGTATGGGTDYTLANGMLSFSAGTTSLPIPISGIVDDNIHEGDETVILTLSSPTGATLGTNTVHTYTITENDTLPTLSVADLSNAEGAFGVNAQPNVAVTLSHPSSQSVSFDWSTQDRTATSAGSDYASDNGTLYISAGTTSVNISPVIFGDDNYEQSETFSLVLSNPSNATILDGTGIITLTNDDNLPSLGVSLQGLALEGGGNASLDIALDNVAGVNVSFDYTTIDNTAAAGSEYTATSGTATIAAGAPNTIIQVPLINNSVDNSDKTFTFTISNPVRAVLGTSSETVTIIDDEAVVSINDITVNETDSTATFTVTVQGPMTASTLDVDFTTLDGSAAAGSDYASKSGTLSFASSQAIPFNSPETKTIIVNLSDDAVTEGSESFDVSLSNIVSGGSVVMPDNTGTASITDNDASSVEFNATSSSGAESVSSAALQVDLSNQSASAVTVDYAVTGTATGSGADYTLANGTLTIPANTSSANITIGSIVDDSLVEGNETVIVTLSNPSGATLGTDTVHTYTITDNDASSVEFNATSSSGAESVSSAALQVDLSNQSASAVTVDYAVTGTATGSGADYTLANGTLTIPANTSSANITIGSIVDDSLVEGNETVIVTLSNPSGATLGTDTVHTYTITDSDASSVEFNATSSSGAESVSSAALQVDLSNQSASAVTVDYAVTGTATGSGADYTLANGTLTIPANTSSANITIGSIVDDSLVEGNETVIVTLSNPSGATLGTDTVHTYTITDNDASSVEFNATSSSGAESVSSAALQVDLSNQSASAVTVDYAVTGTATGSGADYTLANGTLTIPANTSSANITIGSIVDDSLVEGNETVIVTLSNPSGATLGTDTVHTYTITDNDVPTISVSSAASASEAAGTHVFTVSLSAPATTALSVDFATSDGTALAGSDYTSITSTLSFAVGDQSKTVLVTILDDSDAETSESFSLTLSNPVNITLGTSTVSVSITDNDSGVDLSLVDEAEKYVRDISDQLAQEKGHDLIEASHRLIRTSLDSIMTKSSVFANKGEGNSQGQSVGFAQITSSTNRQAFFSQPNSAIPDAKTTFNQNLIGAVKSLDVIADGESHHAHFDYDLYTPLIRSNDRLITKIAAQTSKQKDGPEARRLIASFALEKKAGDDQSAIGRFVHVTHENADFNTDYKGDKNTSGVNIGIYKVYTADVDALNSTYISAGISNTDLSLEKSGMLLDSSYLSYQFQTGFSVGRVYIAKRFTGMLEFTLDALYDYQIGHDLNITSGISKFNRLMSGKGHYEIIARFEPKANFEFGETQNAGKRILQVTPLLKCGTGTMTLDCGGGIATKVSSPFEVDKGHISFGIRYEHYRDTDFMEYMMNINQNLFNSDQIKLNTELKVDTNDDPTSSNAGQYALGSSLNVTF